VIPENHNDVILGNTDAKNAIFGFSFGDYQKRIVPNPDGSRLGAVDGVTPTVQAIANGTFPFGRFRSTSSAGRRRARRAAPPSPPAPGPRPTSPRRAGCASSMDPTARIP
jgi:hypothetical protein